LLKGLFTLREMRVSGWNCAWSQDITPERLQEFEELGKATNWDYFRITYNEARQDTDALAQLRQKGYPMLELPTPVQYVIDLGSGFEGYLKSLSHNGRKGLKKKVRRGADTNPHFVACTETSEIEPFFAELFLHHIAYWDAKAGGSYYNAPEERTFTLAWAKELHQQGHLHLERLVMNGDTVNLSVGLRYGDTFYWLLTINTGLHSEFVPGMIGLYMRLEQLAADGVTRFNMGTGDYFYKVQSANSRELCREIIVANPSSLRGRAYLAWLKNRSQKQQATAPATDGE
jgi:CelD/BcsL family acetyltransferase involved in cellulose biosynthesis